MEEAIFLCKICKAMSYVLKTICKRDRQNEEQEILGDEKYDTQFINRRQVEVMKQLNKALIVSEMSL